MKFLNKIIFGGCILAGSFSVCAYEMREGAVLVNDPHEKIQMGFNADAEVYRMPKNSSNANEPEQSILGGSLVRLGYLGVESQGRASGMDYSTISGAGDIYRSGGFEQFRDILIEMPENYLYNFVRLWGFDENVDEDLAFFVFESCLPLVGAGTPTFNVLDSIESSGSAGNWSDSISMGNIAINSDECTYWIRTRFDTTDDSLRLFKVRAQLIPAAP